MDKARLLKPLFGHCLLHLPHFTFQRQKHIHDQGNKQAYQRANDGQGKLQQLHQSIYGHEASACSTHNSSSPAWAAGRCTHSPSTVTNLPLLSYAQLFVTSAPGVVGAGGRLALVSAAELRHPGRARSSTHSSSTLSVFPIFPPVNDRIHHLCGQQPEPSHWRRSWPAPHSTRSTALRCKSICRWRCRRLWAQAWPRPWPRRW